MIKVLIVEDEILIATRIEYELKKQNIEVCGIALDIDEAIRILDNNKVDIALLDVNISGKKTGIDIGDIINQKYQIPFIFLTSYSDADTKNKIINTKAAGYLLKPVNYNSLITTIELCFSNHQQKTNSITHVSSGKSSFKIDINNLLFIISNHVYVDIHLNQKKLFIRSSLNKILKEFPENSLVKINRSTLINPKKISKLNSNRLLINDIEFKISETYYQDFAKIYFN